MNAAMELLGAIRAGIMKRIHQLTAYVATLYFFEIIFLMFGLLFLYGPVPSITTGAILSLLLAYHIIQLYYRKKVHRIIQLCLIDFHAAFAAGYLFYSAASGAGSDPGTPLVMAVRSLLLACEIPLLYFLSGSEAAESFRQETTGPAPVSGETGPSRIFPL
jgi:hypothetical protein